MYRPSMNFADKSNQLARAKATCIKCKGANDTGYTMCKPCADQVEYCVECGHAPSEQVVKFSKSVYGKVLCWNDQPAQVRERELARKESEKNAS